MELQRERMRNPASAFERALVPDHWNLQDCGDKNESEWVPSPPGKPNLPRVAPVLPGRIDPCPCGSRKKYKKCCLGKDA